MTTANLKINCTLNNEHFEDIVDTAGLIIGYWADSASIETVSEDSDELIYRVREQDGAEFVLTKADIEASLRDIIEGNFETSSTLQQEFAAFCLDKDQGDLDAESVDTLIQFACFQELVYA
jgi:hypothetical protein